MDTSPSHSRLSYRPDIDGLRAIAVLAVVFCHAGLGLPGGYIGVDVFFVISGFLITSLILKDLNQGKFSLLEFWERRIRRIFPALFAVTLVTLVAGWALLFPEAYVDLAKSTLGLIFLASNIYFCRTTGYFATAAEEKPLLHTWSLAVEEQFYLIVPLFLILLAKTKQLQRALPILTLVMVGSFALSVRGVTQGEEGAFYLLPSRAWELLAGVFLAFLSVRGVGGPARFGNLLAALGLALILAPCFLYNENTAFPGMAAVPPVLGTVLLIWCGMQARQVPFITQLLATRPVVFVGLISYSLYLWHWPLLVLTKSELVFPPNLGMRISLVAISILLAIASWRFIETPFRRRQLLAPTRSLLLASAGCFLLLFGMSGILTVRKGFESRVPRTARKLAAFSRVDDRYKIEVNKKDLPNKLPILGSGHTPPEFLVWGDSHAMALLPAVASVCDENGIRAFVATHSATPPILNYSPPTGMRDRAIPFNQAVFDFIQSGKVKAVVLIARWDQYFEDPQFADAFQSTIEALRSSKVHAYVVMDFMFPYDVPKALALYRWRGRDLSGLTLNTEMCDLQRKRYSSFFAKLARDGVTVLDPIPVFEARTGSHEFIPYDSGGLFYRDKHHLSTYGALALKPLFSSLLEDLRKTGTPQHAAIPITNPGATHRSYQTETDASRFLAVTPRDQTQTYGL